MKQQLRDPIQSSSQEMASTSHYSLSHVVIQHSLICSWHFSRKAKDETGLLFLPLKETLHYTAKAEDHGAGTITSTCCHRCCTTIFLVGRFLLSQNIFVLLWKEEKERRFQDWEGIMWGLVIPPGITRSFLTQLTGCSLEATTPTHPSSQMCCPSSPSPFPASRSPPVSTVNILLSSACDLKLR